MAKKTILPTLINYTNTPVANWSDAQKEKATTLYANIIDKALPKISAHLSIQEMYELLADEFGIVMDLIQKYAPKQNMTCHVLIEGEAVFLYNMIDALHSENIRCFTPVYDNNKFVQFRPYADYDALSAQNEAEEKEIQNVMDDLQDSLKEFENLYKPKK